MILPAPKNLNQEKTMPKKVCLEFSVNTPAFESNPALEISRILKGLGYMFQEVPIDIENFEIPLFDKQDTPIGRVWTSD